jgi:hypothetical protein
MSLPKNPSRRRLPFGRPKGGRETPVTPVLAKHALDYEALAEDVMRRFPRIMARLGE